jgi:hypothetical protein
VALAHDRCRREQASGKWASAVVGAAAQVVERIEAVGDARDRDPAFAVGQVIRNNEVVRDRIARPDRAEGVSREDRHRQFLLIHE